MNINFNNNKPPVKTTGVFGSVENELIFFEKRRGSTGHGYNM